MSKITSKLLIQTADTTVTKKTIEVFEVHYKPLGIQSTINLDVWEHQKSKAIKISVAGDHINGYHTFVSNNPKEFIKSLDFDYTMAKIDHDNYEEIDWDEWESEFKRFVIEDRLENPEDTTKDIARGMWQDIERAFYDHRGSVDLVVNAIYTSEYFDEVFFDGSNIPNVSKRPSSQALAFWKWIWLPFVEAYCSKNCELSTTKELCVYEPYEHSDKLYVTGCDHTLVNPAYSTIWEFCPSCGKRISLRKEEK